jgi:hypothetical protein
MGAHPAAPSGVERSGARTTLEAVIAADPAGELGPECAKRFGGRLPFLLKVLAAEKALSLQVHPSKEQAEAGFREENERGLAPTAAGRNYVDDWPKPEMLCALTPFEVLAGMRTTDDAAALFDALGVPDLEPLASDLDAAAGPGALTDVLARILSWPASQRSALIASVVAACERLAAGSGPYAAACAATVRVAAEHPGDLGIVASLLLRHAVLQPGQAVFLPAWCGRALPASTSTSRNCSSSPTRRSAFRWSARVRWERASSSTTRRHRSSGCTGGRSDPARSPCRSAVRVSCCASRAPCRCATPRAARSRPPEASRVSCPPPTVSSPPPGPPRSSWRRPAANARRSTALARFAMITATGGMTRATADMTMAAIVE